MFVRENQLDQLLRVNRERQAEWDPENKITLTYRGNELAGEIGELCNMLKKIERKALGLRGSVPTKDEVIKEIGDGAICLSLICMDLDVDFWEAIRYAFNTTSEKYDLKTRL